MDKTVIALGLMSGTSMDGIDASLVRSDGEKIIDIIGNLYIKYDSELKNNIFEFSKKIKSINDLKSNVEDYNNLERKITIKHSEIAQKISNQFNTKINIIGFHGQTILHKPKENYSIQMGNGKLLSQILNTDVVYQFRKKDLINGGEGAPLTPIYHHNLKKKLKINEPAIFLNIGGIANYTFSKDKYFCANDAGPGNCLMDLYTKITKNLDYDKDGNLAAAGKVDSSLINNILDHEFYNSKSNHSLDIKDFDINFVKGLPLQDALANLNYFSARIIYENIKKNIKDNYIIILCGGGRKNKTLVSNLKTLFKVNIFMIDDFQIDGDFVESQAFAYLSIRSLYKKEISFPNTTRVKLAITGGELIKSN
tara:strand:+ start:38 stop:1135 length:1098 start_codon:yes stop_codon:yes gene_type:complete